MSPAQGDEHITWDPNDEASVATAKKAFDDATAKGHRAFKVSKQKGDPIGEFDPSLTELLLVPALSGG